MINKTYMIQAVEDKRHTKEQILIFLAISCQFITGSNFYSINNYLKISEGVFGNQLDSTQWVVFCFFGRLLGVCILGKYAERFGFFKSMHVVSGLFVTFTTLFLFFCFMHHSFPVTDERFYLFRLYHCFLEPAALFLPYIYLFNKIPSSNHFITGAYLVFGVFLGKVATYGLKFIQAVYPTGWAVIPVITTLLAWGIYGYLQMTSLKNLSTDAAIITTKPFKIPIPLKVKTLSLLLGAACATAIFYNHTFLSHYMHDIAVIDPRFNISGVLYYSLWVLCLIPGVKLTEYFGFLKVARCSLIGLVILTFNPFFTHCPPVIYPTCQVVFAICSAFFVAPLLAVLHKLYTPYPSTFHRMFWYVFGFGLCILFAFFEKTLAFQQGYSGLGWCVFSASLGLCLLALLLEDSNCEKGFLNVGKETNKRIKQNIDPSLDLPASAGVSSILGVLEVSDTSDTSRAMLTPSDQHINQQTN